MIFARGFLKLKPKTRDFTSSVSVVRKTNDTICLSAKNSLGIAPFKYQWFRSQTSNFPCDDTTLISGAIDATLTDRPCKLGVWFYRCIITDASGGQSVSQQVSSALLRPPVKICVMSDSIMSGTWTTRGNTIPSEFADTLSCAINRPVLVSNRAIPGSRIADWQPGSSAYSDAIAAFVLAFGAPHPKTNPIYVLIEFVNDYRFPLALPSRSELKTLYQNVCNDLVSRGFTPVLNTPMCVRDQGQENYHDTASAIALGQQIGGILDELSDGSTILRGTDVTWEYTATHLEDTIIEGTGLGVTAVHPTPIGAESRIFQNLAAFAKILT